MPMNVSAKTGTAYAHTGSTGVRRNDVTAMI